MSHGRGVLRFAKPMYGPEEERAVAELLRKARYPEPFMLTNGGKVAQFEERFVEFTGGGIAVAVSSCASALHLCLLAMGIGRGDIVIVPALTHVAMANAVELTGATCRFVDSHQESGNMDPDKIDMRGVRLITTVHFLGQPSYMMSLVSIARKYGVEIVEDCALALGASHSGRHVGLVGSAGCFSFYPAKHITTGEGGLVLTTNPELADKLRKLRSFGYGANRDGGVSQPSLNHRMTEIQAALGIVQLQKAHKLIEQRRANSSLLKDMLAEFQPIGGDYAVAVRCDNRDEVRQRMLVAGVETSIYYPKPVPRHPYYANKYIVHCPVADDISANTIALSVGPHLNAEKMERIARTFRNSLKGKSCVSRSSAGLDSSATISPSV